ncbi:MAG TPA: hypothetical protein PLD25_10035 [Chloroflexota bacterium]|nr:hypothetical protein [Chloroflexota bacterium]HUM71916.1 hypothetical protein [Chloroflexota bacterium]
MRVETGCIEHQLQGLPTSIKVLNTLTTRTAAMPFAQNQSVKKRMKPIVGIKSKQSKKMVTQAR